MRSDSVASSWETGLGRMLIWFMTFGVVVTPALSDGGHDQLILEQSAGPSGGMWVSQEQIHKLLTTPNARMKCTGLYAVLNLKSGASEFCAEVAELLSAHEPELRAMACLALKSAGIRSEGDFTKLFEIAQRDQSVLAKVAALETLVRLRAADANTIAAVRTAVNRGARGVKLAAIRLIGDAPALWDPCHEMLLPVLAQEDEELAAEAERALVLRGDTCLEEVLAYGCDHGGDAKERVERVVDQMGPEIIGPGIDIVVNGDPEYKALLVREVSRFGPAVVPKLRSILPHVKDMEVARYLLDLTARMNRDAVPLRAEIVALGRGSTDPYVVRAVVGTLKAMGPGCGAEGRTYLEELLSDAEDPVWAEDLKKALAEVTPK